MFWLTPPAYIVFQNTQTNPWPLPAAAAVCGFEWRRRDWPAGGDLHTSYTVHYGTSASGSSSGVGRLCQTLHVSSTGPNADQFLPFAAQRQQHLQEDVAVVKQMLSSICDTKHLAQILFSRKEGIDSPPLAR